MGQKSEYPAIKAFVRGYLHQDAVAEYGSARAAAQQFCRDADQTQLDELRREWKQFQARHTSLNEINDKLHQFRCAWQFHSTGEFARMLDAFVHAPGRNV